MFNFIIIILQFIRSELTDIDRAIIKNTSYDLKILRIHTADTRYGLNRTTSLKLT
jgi:hypothetical protein